MATIYYTGCTLDGFIATDDHSLDWLTSRDIDQDGPMGYPGFRERIGACVMGATTWQWILDHDEEPWGPLPTWVMAHRTFPEAPASVRFDRDDVRRALLALPGIGPWTADYVAMRALGHPDVFLPTDLAVRRVLAELTVGEVAPDPHAWRPWRSYALMHLWNPLMPPTPAPDTHPTAAPRPSKET